ncbi:CHY and RING finger domain protein, putative [Paecilomyces variotii No. 5]|uniref:CHY and RING finger domain protein, putative n=1 Tax=Byssochlamys spectabilis (strain No. 5 / NBRC 109023) TaxID=1356009 RepID=V5FJE3_BYSSN|nr:CHY and RING finger domain protein, putative [Paecilomyces variotii No. 5]
MSGFISSLLIDPVFRQARRLSRRSSSDRSPSPIDHPSVQHASAPNSVSWPASFRNNYDTSSAFSRGSTGRRISSVSLDLAPGRTLSSSMPLTIDRRQEATHEPGDNGYNSHSDAGDAIESQNGHSYTDSGSQRTRRAVDMPSDRTPLEAGNSISQGPRIPTQRLSWDGKGKSALPEDDGMGHLRMKIHAIRDKDIPNAEKARLILNLMTEDYRSSQTTFNSIPRSPSSLPSVDRPWTPASHRSLLSLDQLSLTPASTVSIPSPNNPYNLTAEDLHPTFAPSDQKDESREMEQTIFGDVEDEPETACLGCRHYKRNVKLQCYTCKRWYTCRFCHDELEDHALERRKTENMLCMFCGCPQPASQSCIGCGEQAALYYCSICKLWDNDEEKSIYHCNDCGICRIGQGLGKDFFHCKTCSVCMPISIENTHRCIERSTQCDCPLCGDYMFTSPETVVFMRYRTIAAQPMPPEFKDTKALIYFSSGTILGMEANQTRCESYNTVQIQLLTGSESDNASLGHHDDHTRPSSLTQATNGGDQDSCFQPGTMLQADSTLPVPSSGSHGTEAPRLPRQSRGRRPVSPVISNYFGLPTEREQSKPASKTSDENRNTGDGLNFWGATNLVSKYTFLGSDTGSTDGEAEDVDDDQHSAEHTGDESDEEEEEEEDEEEDEEDDDDSDSDSIELFGHR